MQLPSVICSLHVRFWSSAVHIMDIVHSASAISILGLLLHSSTIKQKLTQYSTLGIHLLLHQLSPSSMSTRYALSKANQADDLFGYNFDATNLRSLQLELLQNYRLSTEARAEISTELGRRFDTMCQAAMKLLTAQCACAACGECPLVIGSRHEAMPVRTLKLFMQLTTQITSMFSPVHDT